MTKRLPIRRRQWVLCLHREEDDDGMYLFIFYITKNKKYSEKALKNTYIKQYNNMKKPNT